MKAVMISIRPRWCELIASGKKTVEVRKTRPKLETPFKCYIYCAKHSNEKLSHWSGMVIGEFICDRVEHFDSAFDEYARAVAPPGSIIDSMGWEKFLEIIEKQACIQSRELEEYFPEDVKAYLWHISSLEIYDKPKYIDDFRRDKKCGEWARLVRLKRPPQSWCYVEEEN